VVAIFCVSELIQIVFQRRLVFPMYTFQSIALINFKGTKRTYNFLYPEILHSVIYYES